VQLGRDAEVIAANDGLDALVSAASGGIGRAGEILLARARGVGALLAQVDAMLGPDLIVVSSGVLAVDGALERVADALRANSRTQPPPVRASRYGANPLVSAAAALMLERSLLSSDPLADLG
jgi:predicted NBD/HSP70 family sugar kinase